jgi:hypothetical protein
VVRGTLARGALYLVFVNDTNQWLVAHARQIAMSLCAIAAAALIIRGTIAAI